MRKDIQGKISITFAIPERYENDDKLCYAYIKYIAEQLAKTDVLKKCEGSMLISELEKTNDETDFFDDKEYYKNYYDAIFPEDMEN